METGEEEPSNYEYPKDMEDGTNLRCHVFIQKKNSDAILGHISSYSGIAKIEHYFSVDCMVM